MAPRLRVSAGPSVDRLSLLRVNDEQHPLSVDSDTFQGRITVRIQHFTGMRPSSSSSTDGGKDTEDASGLTTTYFDHGHARGCTWSIQVQGRFKGSGVGGSSSSSVAVDDVVFGNQFDKPIRDHLPWGTSVALRAISIIDPNMRHDVYCDTPWAFGPMITSMTRVNVRRVKCSDAAQADNADAKTKRSGDDGDGPTETATDSFFAGWPEFPHGGDEAAYVQEDTSVLLCDGNAERINTLTQAVEDEGLADMGTLSQLRDPHSGPGHRARFWSNAAARRAAYFEPDDVVTIAFDNGFIDFNTLRAVLPYTGGMGFDLQHYWDGQPVRYVCKNKLSDAVYFVIEFQIAEKDA